MFLGLIGGKVWGKDCMFWSSKVWERGFGFKISSKGFNLDGVLTVANQIEVAGLLELVNLRITVLGCYGGYLTGRVREKEIKIFVFGVGLLCVIARLKINGKKKKTR